MVHSKNIVLVASPTLRLLTFYSIETVAFSNKFSVKLLTFYRIAVITKILNSKTYVLQVFQRKKLALVRSRWNGQHRKALKSSWIHIARYWGVDVERLGRDTNKQPNIVAGDNIPASQVQSPDKVILWVAVATDTFYYPI